MVNLVDDLRARGIWEMASHEDLEILLNKEKLTFYVGFDPTSKSLQIGNLFVLMTMIRLQRAGHRPVALIGGATGMIGDPSGKSVERQFLSQETLSQYQEGLRAQLEKFLDFKGKKNGALLLNNYDWIHSFSFLQMLRDVGKCFRLNEMLAKDSVKSRLKTEEGLSYTEFSYQVLQSYDFAHLYQNYHCQLQLGATDQWGNITAGIDFTRKSLGSRVFGLVIPLVTDAQGNKFGKSQGAKTIYLDPEMTSPYEMYQFFLNCEDCVVGRYLRYYTFLSLEVIEGLERELGEQAHLRQAQKTLAGEVVGFVHGQEGLDMAERATQFFFGEKIENLSDREVEILFSHIPSTEISRSFLSGEGGDLLEMLAQTPLFESKGQARRSVQQKGVYLNNRVIEEIDFKVNSSCLASESALILRKGKKNYCVIKFIS